MLLKISQLVHRIIGLITTIFIMISIITGVMLLHRDSLSLSDRAISHSALLWFYGEPRTFEIGGEVIEEEYPPTWEKAITAFHGGRFIGKSMPFIMDILAISLLFLSITGPYLWIKRIQNKKSISSIKPSISDDLRRIKGKLEHIYKIAGENGGITEQKELSFIEEQIRKLDEKTCEVMQKIGKQETVSK